MSGGTFHQKKVPHKKRKVELVVISDVHLGTYGCHAKELLSYMKSIKQKTVVLNGDIIDMWQFSKNYFPKSHLHVIRQIIKWSSKGAKVYYIPGNHDELLRKFAGFKMGSLQIVNKLVLDLNGQKTWIFHGDVFDITMQYSKWLMRLGARGYDFLILVNALCNWISQKMGGGKISLSKKIKDNVKSAIRFVKDFEKVSSDIAIANGYDFVVCGHVHHPEIKTIITSKGKVCYMNSGDWIENLTSLEYHEGEWKLHHYRENFGYHPTDEEEEVMYLNNKEVFNIMLKEFHELKTRADQFISQQKVS